MALHEEEPSQSNNISDNNDNRTTSISTPSMGEDRINKLIESRREQLRSLRAHRTPNTTKASNPHDAPPPYTTTAPGSAPHNIGRQIDFNDTALGTVQQMNNERNDIRTSAINDWMTKAGVTNPSSPLVVQSIQPEDEMADIVTDAVNKARSDTLNQFQQRIEPLLNRVASLEVATKSNYEATRAEISQALQRESYDRTSSFNYLNESLSKLQQDVSQDVTTPRAFPWYKAAAAAFTLIVSILLMLADDEANYRYYDMD